MEMVVNNLNTLYLRCMLTMQCTIYVQRILGICAMSRLRYSICESLQLPISLQVVTHTATQLTSLF